MDREVGAIRDDTYTVSCPNERALNPNMQLNIAFIERSVLEEHAEVGETAHRLPIALKSYGLVGRLVCSCPTRECRLVAAKLR